MIAATVAVVTVVTPTIEETKTAAGMLSVRKLSESLSPNASAFGSAVLVG